MLMLSRKDKGQLDLPYWRSKIAALCCRQAACKHFKNNEQRLMLLVAECNLNYSLYNMFVLALKLVFIILLQGANKSRFEAVSSKERLL